MANYVENERKIKQIIDDLKGLCSTNGLSNTANEEVVVTNVFLYKFLNDKFRARLKTFSEDVGMSISDIMADPDGALNAFYDSIADTVVFREEETIEYLLQRSTQQGFGKMFDDALKAISTNPRNENFCIETSGGEKQLLFEKLTEKVEEGKRDGFARNIFAIISQNRFDFSDAVSGSFDFYATIFEYLIKDYNVASGKYAEYFTPQSVSSMIAKILVGMSDTIQAAEICDCAAGSGSLILHLAHELGQEKGMNRAVVYTQDISAKSSRFLRLNLMLNGLMESLPNVIQGDTLLDPAHFANKDDRTSGLKQWDYQTINPPFKTDFSTTRNEIEARYAETDRFFAGVPKIPANKKDSMAIYLCFIQHVMYTMKDTGKAAIVVPTGFLTAQSGIEKTIRQKMLDERMLVGVISMPSNIFANTGTNVSVMFLDKAKKHDKVMLIDASNLGHDEKIGKNKKRVLEDDEMKRIIDTFLAGEDVDDFAVSVKVENMIEKKCSFSAGQYFEVKIEHIDITPEEFNEKMDGYQETLAKLFADSLKQSEKIKIIMRELSFEKEN